MVYRDLTSRSLCAAAIGLALACNPDKGDDTSASDSAVTTGNESTGGASTGPTTGTTTDVDPTTGVTTTGSSETVTSEATSTTSTATSTTGTTTTGETTSDETTSDETTGGAIGCGEDPEFTASWNAWQGAVQANGATYHYSVIRGFGFGPPDYCLYRTRIVVADGVVVERRFEISQMVGNPVECEMPFTEIGEDIGTHDSSHAAVPATVDALYGACCEDVLHIEPAEEYMVTFATDDQGFMKQCYYVANGCADGCDSGPFGATLDFEELAFGDPPAP